MFDFEADERHEFRVKEELEYGRKQIKTFEDLIKYLEEIKDNYNTGYGAAPRAIAQAALATAWFLSSEFGITGFQASATMWDFLTGWSYTGNKCGMKIVNYDKFLYPQYEDYYEKTLSESTFKEIQKVAQEMLENESASHIVRQHWQSIVDGVVPFGYKIEE